MRRNAAIRTRFVKSPLAPSLLCIAALLVGARFASAGVVLQGDTLTVIGTEDEDDLDIIGVDGPAGLMTVQLNDQPLALHVGIHHIFVDLRGGDNYLAMFQVHVEGNVTIVGGDYVNALTLGSPDYLPNLIWGDLTVSADNAWDQIDVDETWIIGNATFDTADDGGDLYMGSADSPSELGVVILGDLSSLGRATCSPRA